MGLGRHINAFCTPNVGYVFAKSLFHILYPYLRELLFTDQLDINITTKNISATYLRPV